MLPKPTVHLPHLPVLGFALLALAGFLATGLLISMFR